MRKFVKKFNDYSLNESNWNEDDEDGGYATAGDDGDVNFKPTGEKFSKYILVSDIKNRFEDLARTFVNTLKDLDTGHSSDYYYLKFGKYVKDNNLLAKKINR